MRHHISIALVALLSAGLAAHFAQAQATAPTKASDTTTPAQGESDADLAAIRAESQAFVAAFNKHDAQAVAAFWTPEGEYIDEAGHRLAGRSEIEKAYTDFFAANPKAQMRIVMHSLRRLGPNLAIEDGSAAVDPSPKGVPGVALYTAVQTKVDGKWRMASVRDTWIETPAAVRSAADLEWLVGTWTGEEHGIRTESVIQWIVDGRFLERRYTTTNVDGTKPSGVQLIGWNPQGGHVQSWEFSPDGGCALGLWTPTDNGWVAEMHGTTGGGIPTAAVNVLRRLDDNAYVWQSVQRSLGDTALPDTNEVVLKRKPTK